MKSILSWGGDKRNHFRLKSRSILEKLVRKFDHEMIASFVPKGHQRLMVHIRKTNEKRKRKKQLSNSGKELDDGDNERSRTRKGKQRLGKMGQVMWSHIRLRDHTKLVMRSHNVFTH